MFWFTQTAFELHIRTLWGLVTQSSIPPPPSDLHMRTFEDRFKSENQVNLAINANLLSNGGRMEDIKPHIQHLRKSLQLDNSYISANINQISEDHLFTMFGAVTAAGLFRWAPDVLGDPDSIYNIVHENIAMVTFRQISAAYGYTFMENNLEMAQRVVVLKVLYRNFVFSYFQNLAKKEARKSGSVMEYNKLKAIYKRRQSVGIFACLVDNVLTVA